VNSSRPANTRIDCRKQRLVIGHHPRSSRSTGAKGRLSEKRGNPERYDRRGASRELEPVEATRGTGGLWQGRGQGVRSTVPLYSTIVLLQPALS
jgi:hypothetical protein